MGKDNDFNTVVEETYYEQGDEELDYDDDAPVRRSYSCPIRRS